MKKKTMVILSLIFLLSLSLRLFFVLQTPLFDLDGAYFSQRQVESILSDGLPNYDDSLSFSGKTQVFAPLFYYVLALFNMFIPFVLVGKLIPNILASFIVFTSYFLAKVITKNENASLFASFLSAFIPVYFTNTLNNISPFSLLMPLILLQVYFFIKRKYTAFIIFSFILPLIHFSALIIPISLIIFLLITKIERYKFKQAYFEMIIFVLALSLWLVMIFFKKAFQSHGLEIIFKNLPLGLLGQHFASLSLLQIIYLIGAIPFIYGIISLYHFLFNKRSFYGFLMMSLVFTPATLLWTALIDISHGLMHLGVYITILFSCHYENIISFVKKSKFSKLKYYKYYFIISSITAFVLTSMIPALIIADNDLENSLSPTEYEALIWLRENTPGESTVVASIKEGNAIAAIARRKNVMDDNFLLVPNINTRFEDFVRIFTSPYKIETLNYMNKYGIDYVYISQRNPYPIYLPKFEDECFKKVFNNEKVTIYEVKCTVED